MNKLKLKIAPGKDPALQEAEKKKKQNAMSKKLLDGMKEAENRDKRVAEAK